MKLPRHYYRRPEVVEIAQDLLGKVLFTNVEGVVTGGFIVETEAYSWRERGCHAFDKRQTARNAVMFGDAGVAYVYLCYGIHYLFNVVTNVPSEPEAVLIRAIEPFEGIHLMQARRGLQSVTHHLTSGPGKLTKALGIDRSFNGKLLTNDEVWIEDIGREIVQSQIQASPRIGIDYAGEDALLPWRFTIKGNPWVSR